MEGDHGLPAASEQEIVERLRAQTRLVEEAAAGRARGAAEADRSPASAADRALTLLSPGEREAVLSRAYQEGPSRTEPDWLIVETVLLARRDVGEMVERLRDRVAENITASESIRALQSEILATAEQVRAERDDRLAKIVEPMVALTRAVVEMQQHDARAAGAADVLGAAEEAFGKLTALAQKSLDQVVQASGRSLALSAFERRWVPFIGLALQVFLVVLLGIVLIRR